MLINFVIWLCLGLVVIPGLFITIRDLVRWLKYEQEKES